MTARRFHRELYLGAAVDEAMKVYARFATITPVEEDTHWVVEVEAGSPARENRIADELANYALGLTIRNRTGRRA